MAFPGEKDLFLHASFHFPTRGFFTILGPSGCGKSTFLHLLSGLLLPKEGRVLYRGKPLSQMKNKERTAFHAKETAFLFQHYELLESCSAIENVSLPLRLSGTSKKKAEERASMF
ncbi:MAG: ATP-binding cassette domain-containing protein, partial [Candidatus Enteromonas sp.]